MSIRYKIFGNVATLLKYRKVLAESDIVTLKCDGAESVRLYSAKRGEYCSKTFVDGEAKFPLEFFEGGVDVTFFMPDGSDAWGTPLKLQRLDGEIYVIGGAFSNREAIERLEEQMVYVVESAEKALEKAARVEAFEKRLERLEQRADSGDILK